VLIMQTPAIRIDALLPQTQCTQCGYEGCMPYAEAIAAGDAEINRCPPGGDAGIAALAQLLDRTPLPLDTSCGLHQPSASAAPSAWRPAPPMPSSAPPGSCMQ